MTRRYENAKEQAKAISQARLLLRPEMVKTGKIPRWLSKRITAYWKARKAKRPSTFSLRDTICDVARRAGLEPRADFLDHYGTTEGGLYGCCDEAGECFVAEPYDICGLCVQLLDALEVALDVEWHITANSWHFPGRTIRITIHEPSPDRTVYRQSRKWPDLKP